MLISLFLACQYHSPSQELEQIEQLKVPYMNCVAAVDHQNEQIIFLLQQLAEQKRQRDDARRTAGVLGDGSSRPHRPG